MRDGIAFPQEDELDLQSAAEFFAQQSHCGVALEDGQLLGLYILHPNNVGRCGHITNASYAVSSKARFFDKVKNPIEIEGYTAAKIYHTMIASNPRIVALDAGAIYSTMVRLRTDPVLAKKVLDFKPTCYQNGCGNTYRPQG